ncbi:Oxidoreductase family, NADbinding Rossmann fold domain containing protein [Balamuthia mandrillaris]
MERDKESKPKVLRWGIISTANIARKFVRAVRGLQDENVVVLGVASRSLERAQEWAKELNIPRTYGSYSALLEDSDIDAVYIPTPTALHAELCLQAANHKKHILCEKPVANSAEELRKVIAACHENAVQFMDGVQWNHNLRNQEMQKCFASIGAIRRVNSSFAIPGPPHGDIRFQTKLEPFGCLGDLGWYNIRACLFAFGHNNLPDKVWATAKFSEEQAIIDCTAVLWFSDNKMASFDCSFLQTAWRQRFELCGEKGSVLCHDFVIPWEGSLKDDQKYSVPSAKFEIHYSQTADAPPNSPLMTSVEVVEAPIQEGYLQEINMVKAFASAVFSEKCNKEWPELSLNTQLILDALYESCCSDNKIVTLS